MKYLVAPFFYILYGIALTLFLVAAEVDECILYHLYKKYNYKWYYDKD